MLANPLTVPTLARPGGNASRVSGGPAVEDQPGLQLENLWLFYFMCVCVLLPVYCVLINHHTYTPLYSLTLNEAEYPDSHIEDTANTTDLIRQYFLLTYHS